MILAAIDTYERLKQRREQKAKAEHEKAKAEHEKAMAKVRAEGRKEGLTKGREAGREAERRRIAKLLEQRGVPLPPELADVLNADPE